MALKVRIDKKFHGFHLNVEFETDGGCMGILGASGCGKSMTLKCVAGIEKPDSGRIVHNERVLFDSEKGINLPARERHVGYLFQNYALFPTMTVEENLKIALTGKGKETGRQVLEQIRRFQLQGLENRLPSQLSGGQQQRVALARMLLCEPEMILLDEPFSALDGFLKDTLQLEMLELLRELNQDVLFVSHSRDEIFRFCDRLILLADGERVVNGFTKEIFRKPEKLEAARLTGCKNISPIERISDHELFALDWNIKLKTDELIGDSIRYIGIRGHNLVPATNSGEENTMKVSLAGSAHTTFQHQYLVENAKGSSAKIWWIREKSKYDTEESETIPLYLKFPKEDLLLLS